MLWNARGVPVVEEDVLRPIPREALVELQHKGVPLNVRDFLDGSWRVQWLEYGEACGWEEESDLKCTIGRWGRNKRDGVARLCVLDGLLNDHIRCRIVVPKLGKLLEKEKVRRVICHHTQQ